jgi:hypothetical protein
VNRRGANCRTGPFEVIGTIFKTEETNTKNQSIFRPGGTCNGVIAATALGEAVGTMTSSPTITSEQARC